MSCLSRFGSNFERSTHSRLVSELLLEQALQAPFLHTTGFALAASDLSALTRQSKKIFFALTRQSKIFFFQLIETGAHRYSSAIRSA